MQFENMHDSEAARLSHAVVADEVLEREIVFSLTGCQKYITT
jgi:hypothetical protein